MTETIPLPSGKEHALSKEGDEMVEDGKTYVWTKRYIDGTCYVLEWTEKPKPTWAIDYSDYIS